MHIWLVLILAQVGWSADFNGSQLNQGFCLVGEFDQNLVTRVTDFYVDNLPYRSVPSFGWTKKCLGDEQGMTFYIPAEQVRELIPLLQGWGYRPQRITAEPRRERWREPRAIQEFKWGNDLVRSVARAMVEPAADLTRLADQLETRFKTWQETYVQVDQERIPLSHLLPLFEGLQSLQREAHAVIWAGRELSRLNPRDMELKLDLQLRHLEPLARGFDAARDQGRPPPDGLQEKLRGFRNEDWESMKAQSPGMSNIFSELRAQAAYYRSLSPLEKALAGRRELIDASLRHWVWNFTGSDNYNLETSELMAHGYLMTLAELRSMVEEREIADVVNRSFMNWGWLYADAPAGPIAREMLREVATLPNLVTYLRLVIAAKLADTEDRPPARQEVNVYARLRDDVHLQPARERGRSRYLIIPAGNLEPHLRPSEARINGGVQKIERWFHRHGRPLIQWRYERGVSLEDLRGRLRDVRSVMVCEEFLSGILASRKRDRD